MAEDKNEDQLPDDRSSLESMLRSLESRAQIARRREDDKTLGEISSETKRVREKLDSIEEPRDLSGTRPTLSDSRGNFAPNPEVAGTGGTGVEASNSTEGGDTAKSTEEVDLSPSETGITDGDKPVGDAADGKRTSTRKSSSK